MQECCTGSSSSSDVLSGRSLLDIIALCIVFFVSSRSEQTESVKTRVKCASMFTQCASSLCVKYIATVATECTRARALKVHEM